MIEVEIKVPLTEETRRKLTAGAIPGEWTVLRDTYYDYADRRLTLADNWLRSRNGSFELKQPPAEGSGRGAVQRYVEITCDREILAALRIKGKDVESGLASAGAAPFATITSVRHKLKKGKFSIDLDETDFGYCLAEVELMVATAEEVDEAHDEILTFLGERGIHEVKKQYGKLAVFLKKNNPDHFMALKRAGVIAGED